MKIKVLGLALITVIMVGCSSDSTSKEQVQPQEKEGKVVVYQVFSRLFGNTNTTNTPWGTIEENGVGKFNDFTDKALEEIHDLGATHIWYTGVLHHAMVADYTAYGISNDDPDVVKGRAGSPYAVKDYYSVDPDMAENVANREEEFLALVDRSHKHNLKVIIDIVPNHIARKYEGLNNPNGVEDFGATDDNKIEYARDNNFYYIPGQAFKVPEPLNGYQPLGGQKAPGVDGKFDENPAKWTGNGSRLAQPHFYDWYETVKINYGVKPDGTKDYAVLPENYDEKSWEEHYAFWEGKSVPSSWIKFRDVALFWTSKGVDGFRYDMAEMVPVEFWSFMNSSIKHVNPDAFLLAEVYNPSLYKDYIKKGKMDYLYDKVGFYDTIKHVVRGHGLTDNIPGVQAQVADIEHHMLHFLENHDEQRLATPDFAGTAENGKPAMVVSTLISTSPTMIYFGQEVGEPALEDGGFGDPTRTSIFDYVGVPQHQKWMNNGAFDGGQLSQKSKDLRSFYKKLLRFSRESSALMGAFEDIHLYNKEHNDDYDHRVYSFVRWSEDQKVIVTTNFDQEKSYSFDLQIPASIVQAWNLNDGTYELSQVLNQAQESELRIENGIGHIIVNLEPLESLVYKF